MKQPSNKKAKQEVNKADKFIGQLYDDLIIKLNKEKNKNGRPR